MVHAFLVELLDDYVVKSLPAFCFFAGAMLFNSMLHNFSAPLVSVSEHLSSTAPLHQTTLFPYANSFRRPSLAKATVAFSFRSVDFQKKRALPFFIAIELLTQQKCVASLARRNVLA